MMNPIRWLLWKFLCLPWGHTPATWLPLGDMAWPGLQHEHTHCRYCGRRLGRTVRTVNGARLVHESEVVD